MNVAVYLGSSMGNDPTIQAMTQKVGEWLAKHHHTLVYGGAQNGLMGVVADSVLANGGHVIGVIPQFLERKEQAHANLDELHIVDTMAQRKTMMIELADAFIAMPGGPGTLEEVSEIISKIRLDQLVGPCILFDLDHYYDPLKAQIDKMIEYGYVDASIYDSVFFVSTMDALAHILDQKAEGQ